MHNFPARLLSTAALVALLCSPSAAAYRAVTAFTGGSAAHPCPGGWHQYADANGRVLIGAGYFRPKSAADAHFYPAPREDAAAFILAMKQMGLADPGNPAGVDTFKPDPSTGGDRSILLDGRNIPTLSINSPVIKQASGDPRGSHFLGAQGQPPEEGTTNTPTNNLNGNGGVQVPVDITPRYIAIYYCEAENAQ